MLQGAFIQLRRMDRSGEEPLADRNGDVGTNVLVGDTIVKVSAVRFG